MKNGGQRKTGMLFLENSGTQDNDEQNEEYKNECSCLNTEAGTRANAYTANSITHRIHHRFFYCDDCITLLAYEWSIITPVRMHKSLNNPHVTYRESFVSRHRGAKAAWQHWNYVS